MSRPGRVAWLCALSVVVGAALLPSAAMAQAPTAPRVLLAIYTSDPNDNLDFGHTQVYEPKDRLLRQLETRRSLSFGYISTVQGDYSLPQALLDVSQGTRQSTFIYKPRSPRPLTLVRAGAGGVLTGWRANIKRAKTASVTIKPGLLAASVPGGAGYAGISGYAEQEAIAAADTSGQVAAVSLGPAETVVARARELLRTKRLVVVTLPRQLAGLQALDKLIAARAPGELIMFAQIGPTPPKQGYNRAPSRYFKTAAFAIDEGGPARSVTSDTTRQDGLVSAIDVAPTALHHLGLSTPKKMRGTSIRSAPRLSAKRLEELRRRWSDVRGGRQSSSMRAVVALAGLIFLIIGALRGLGAAVAPAFRIGALGLMWWPSMVLLAGTLEPQRKLTESAFIASTSIVLGLITDRLLPWPRGPALPAVVGLLFYTGDLAGGADLLTRSALGPSVSFGARFYGISNELEPLLPILALTGLAAVFSGRPLSKRVPVVYACVGLALGVVMGWGKLGADVGGVLTVAGAFTAATLVMLPGGITKRSLLIAAAMPFAALGALIALDLGLSGGDHLSRNLLRAENTRELWELVSRRYILAFNVLRAGRTPAYFAGAALAVAFAWRNREILYGPIRHEKPWAAVLLGGLAAGVVGMLTNDSGPILLINAVFAVGAATAYMLGGRAQAVASQP